MLWAEVDKEKAADNTVVSEAKYENGVYTFMPYADIDSGNYLFLAAEYQGTDLSGNYLNDDEFIEAYIRLGVYEDGSFVTKYTYLFDVAEGRHQYLFRVSSDYYWYSEEINAVAIDIHGELTYIDVKILEGD